MMRQRTDRNKCRQPPDHLDLVFLEHVGSSQAHADRKKYNTFSCCSSTVVCVSVLKILDFSCVNVTMELSVRKSARQEKEEDIPETRTVRTEK